MINTNINRSRGGIEVLLLLVCIVGVVAFFSISLAFTTVLMEPEVYDDLKLDVDELREKKVASEQRLQQLNNRLKSLKRKEGLKTAVVHGQDLEYKNNIVDKKITLSNLQKRYEALLEYQNETPQLRVNLKKLRKERRSLQADVSELKLKSQYKGLSGFKTPLHIECYDKGIKFYPGGKIVKLRDIDSTIKKMVKGHDLVAFWIRPNGIETYNKSKNIVEKMDVAISYEPVLKGTFISSIVKNTR